MREESLEVLILGGTGFIGRELGQHLVSQGLKLTIATRSPGAVRGKMPFPCDIMHWDGTFLAPQVLEHIDVIINLAGENIFEKSWSQEQRAKIVASRADSVHAISRAIKTARRKPKVVIQASAVGIYGDRGDEELIESSTKGSGFLVEAAERWESATTAISEMGVRLVVLRLGVVIGATGGALTRLIALYSKGLGSSIGDGKQWFSWIHAEDLNRMIHQAIADHRWHGNFNATAPFPCRNRELDATMREAGQYQGFPNAPRFAVKMFLGEKSDLVLASSRVIPQRALQLGFQFRYPSIQAALGEVFSDVQGKNLRRLTIKQWIPFSLKEAWAFFSEARNLERITPDWLSFQVDRVSTPAMQTGTAIDYSLKLRSIPLKWQSIIGNVVPESTFTDLQTKGPYAVWHHRHDFQSLAGGTLVTDTIQYRLPMAPVGEAVAGEFVASDLNKIFTFRSNEIRRLSSLQ